MRKGEELKTPRHASAAASRDDRLPNSQQVYILTILNRVPIVVIRKQGLNIEVVIKSFSL